MQGLFISQKWSSNFGFDEDEVNFLNYMTKKNYEHCVLKTHHFHEKTKNEKIQNAI